MSDFQIDSGESDSSGKSGGNQSPTVLILFSVPFLLFGIPLPLAAAIRNPKMEKMFRSAIQSAVFLPASDLASSSPDFVYGKRRGKLPSLQAQHPDQPWLWRADWAGRKNKIIRARAADSDAHHGACLLRPRRSFNLFRIAGSLAKTQLRRARCSVFSAGWSWNARYIFRRVAFAKALWSLSCTSFASYVLGQADCPEIRSTVSSRAAP